LIFESPPSEAGLFFSPGRRQLRYRIAAVSLGGDEINDLSATVEARLPEASDVAADTTFHPDAKPLARSV
jgi:hypothetical protein